MNNSYSSVVARGGAAPRALCSQGCAPPLSYPSQANIYNYYCDHLHYKERNFFKKIKKEKEGEKERLKKNDTKRKKRREWVDLCIEPLIIHSTRMYYLLRTNIVAT